MIKLALFTLALAIGAEAKYSYEIKQFQVPLDHFSYVNDVKFNIRYLINDTYSKDGDSPIFFYTGNEGSIETFADNTGLIWELAPKFHALIIFAEHRYYGKSLPFGNQSYSGPDKLGYLTSEQALADFAALIKFLNPNNFKPVITFGGSYGGMLSAWIRMKYPHLVDGAIAASAPIRQFEVDCDIFNRILTSVYKTAYNANCSSNIQQVWTIMKKMMGTNSGKDFLNTQFKFCTNLTKPEDLDKFFDYLNDVLGNLAMQNYPYPSEFLAPLPAYPVREFCYRLNKTFSDSQQLIEAFTRALAIYTNNPKCLNISSAFDQSMGDEGWNFQACTEMVMPMCQNGSSNDMFLPKPWNFTAYSDDCFKKFKVRPRSPQEAVTEYGGGQIDFASNIIFSNGLLDPWSGGGIFNPPMTAREVYSFIIPEGAHHIDLRASNKDDPESVVDLRRSYVQILDKWIKSAQYGAKKGKKRTY